VGTRGDLLALVDRAPGTLRTIEAAMVRWTSPEPCAEPEPGDEPTSDVDPGDAGADADADADADSGAPDDVEISYILVDLPDRWRVVGRGHIAVSDGHQSWVGTGSLVTERDSARAAIHDAGPIGACLYPGALLGWLDFGVPEPAEVEGRSCWVVDAHPRPRAGRGGLAGAAVPNVSGLPDEFVGDDHRFWFDAVSGIVLRHEGSSEGRPCSRLELTDLVIDELIPVEEFAPPPQAIVRSSHELLRDHLAELGVDPDVIDLDDPAQVRRALRQGFGSDEVAAAIERRRESHVPVGPGPLDPDAAREAIRVAVENVGQAAADGSLTNVQAGEGLAAVFEQTRLSAPGQPAEISTVLDDLRFLSSDRAVIWYSVLLDGRALSAVAGREGYAVLVEGRWLVERATFADVVGLAGVACPPPRAR
jgi:hypothetical protein